MKSKKPAKAAQADAVTAVADGAEYYTMTPKGFLRLAQCLEPHCARFRQYLLDRGVVPEKVTETEAGRACMIESRRYLERQERWHPEKRSQMRVVREDAARLLKEAGVASAGSLGNDQLAQKLMLYDQLPEKARQKVRSIGMKKLQGEVLAALGSGEVITVIDEPEDRPPPEEKPQFITKKKIPKGRRVKNDVEARGVGIKAFIVEQLLEASEKKPATRDQVTKAVVKRYPDRAKNSLKGTVAYYVPGYLRRSGFDVKAGPGGYWLEKKKEVQ